MNNIPIFQERKMITSHDTGPTWLLDWGVHNLHRKHPVLGRVLLCPKQVYHIMGMFFS